MNTEETDNQQDISKVPAHLQPHVFKKGQSGNPLGRPPGRTLKERARLYLAGLTDEEAVEFFEGMNKKDVWEMAEGKAESKTEVTATVEVNSISNEEKNALLSLLNDKGGIN